MTKKKIRTKEEIYGHAKRFSPELEKEIFKSLKSQFTEHEYPDVFTVEKFGRNAALHCTVCQHRSWFKESGRHFVNAFNHVITKHSDILETIQDSGRMTMTDYIQKAKTEFEKDLLTEYARISPHLGGENFSDISDSDLVNRMNSVLEWTPKRTKGVLSSLVKKELLWVKVGDGTSGLPKGTKLYGIPDQSEIENNIEP